VHHIACGVDGVARTLRVTYREMVRRWWEELAVCALAGERRGGDCSPVAL